MRVSLVVGALIGFVFTAHAALVRPDRIEAAPGVDVAVLENGDVMIAADGREVEEVRLIWKRAHASSTRICRNDWERDYAEAGWTTLTNNPGSAWYFLVREGHRVDGWGVATQPNALCWWTVSETDIVLTLDVRAGGAPLRLGSRMLTAARLVMREGQEGESAYAAGRAFCRMMCPNPRLPKAPVYGYNDWYCAYGKNTATNFLADAAFMTSLAQGLENRPYVVMDDGWQPNAPPVVKPLGLGSSGWGPWDRSGEAFGMAMKPFATAVAALGAKPGLWYRPYRAWDEVPADQKLKNHPLFFDPTAPGVRERFVADIARFRDWGFRLVKIDYLVGDVAGTLSFPRKVGGRPVQGNRGWRDVSRTTAEVLLDHYRAMRAAAGDDVVLIGCNGFDHLIAGLFELQRVGGDTSGWRWTQTKEMGVNSLGARAIHDGTFYASDADCVGLAKAGAVDWRQNRQWLDLVSRSGTPLFISWHRSLMTDDIREDFRRAFRAASGWQATAEPLSWEYEAFPSRWRLADGSTVCYDWDLTNETARWQAEIDRVAAVGGGVVSVPAGIHKVGGLELRNGVELHLEKGAVLEALCGLENYRVVKLPYSEGDWSAIIMGLNVTNVAVTGEGTVDGQGPLWPPTPKGFKGCHEGLRPRGLFFAYSKGVRLEGYTLRNTACWGQVFKNCDGVTARNVTVFNHGNQNNDGFDIEAKNVLIENCVLDTNDDEYCIKSNDPDFTVENVTIRNCIARGQASAFKIGTATRGTVRHVRVENLRCEPTRGIFSQYADGTPAKYLYHLGVYNHPESYPYGFGLIGIAIECVDGGRVEDVVVDGVTFVDGYKIPIFVRADRRAHHHEDDGFRRGEQNVLKDIVIRNLKGYVIGPTASSITGTKAFRVKNVLLENIDIVQLGAGEAAGRLALEDPTPYRENCYPAPDIFYPGILPAYGLYVDYADDVVLKNVRFRTLAEGPVEIRPDVVRTGR